MVRDDLGGGRAGQGRRGSVIGIGLLLRIRGLESSWARDLNVLVVRRSKARKVKGCVTFCVFAFAILST